MISLGSAGALAADSKTPFPPCTTVPTEADRNAAKGAFAAGQGSFNEADYATAITYWRDAYRRDCTAHALLLNLARAYELKGERSEAVNSLETYLQRKPDASDADQIRRRIDNLKAQMAAAAPPPTAAPVSQPAPTTTSIPYTTPTPPEPEHGRSALPLIVAGGGALIAIIGAGVYSAGSKKVSDFEAACPNRKCPQDKPNLISEGNDARAQQNLGGALIGIGAAGAAAGLIWWFASAPKKTSAQGLPVHRADVTPVVTPGFTGFSLAGSF
jgi:hypothetical protein